MNLFSEAPREWIKASVGNYCDVRLGKMLQNEPSSEGDELKPYLRAINIAKGGLDLSHEFKMWISPDEIERFRLEKGDILVSEGGDAGRVAIFDSEREYYFQNAINRVRPNSQDKILSDFIYYWFAFLKTSGYVEMICNVATIPHFTAEKVKATPLMLPPLNIQQRIADFLDERTTRIDGLIAKKTRLLELLAEQRQALITRAVTKGLDPSALMKPSGMNLFSKAPKEWIKASVGKYCDVRLGKMLQNEPSSDNDELKPYLRAINIAKGGLDLSHEFKMWISPDEIERFRLEKGDILVSEGGDAGRVAIFDSEREYYFQNAINRVRPNSQDKILSDFIYYWFAFLKTSGYVEMICNVATIPHFTAEKVKATPLMLPPLNIQKRIADFLDEQTAQIDHTVTKVQASIGLLREYRAALITAAVTGKIATLLPAVVTQAAARQAPAAFKRAVLAAYIADRMCDQATFGRVKFQKTLHLAEAHLGIDEVEGQYYRKAAGPFDPGMMRSVHSQLKKQGWIIAKRREGNKGTQYRRGAKIDAYKTYFDRYFSDKKEAIDRLLTLMKPMKTQQAEIVSTCFAAWNDLRIEGKNPSDDDIVDLIWNDWDASKRNIARKRWYDALSWMRSRDIVPQRRGKHTKKKAKK